MIKIVGIVFGLLLIFMPKATLMMKGGYFYNNQKNFERAIKINRITGVFMIIFMLILLII